MFLVVPPQLIDATALLSSNVVETAPDAYDAGTTYGLDDTVAVAGAAGAIDVYTSLQVGNLANTPASSPLWWTLTGRTFEDYDAGATYALDHVVLDPASHAVFKSLQGSNTGHALPVLPDRVNEWWVRVRASNRHAMFDNSNSSQTVNPEEIVVTIQADGLVDSVGLDNIDAATVRIVQTDSIEGVVYDETFDLLSDSGIDDFWPWCFYPPVRRRELLVTDLLPYADCTITITLAAPAQDVACGTCVVGLSRELGGTRWGPTAGFKDYSFKELNDFGDYEIAERAYSKIGDFLVLVNPDNVDEAQRLFIEYRAKPLMLQADPRWGVTLIFGIVLEFHQEIEGPEAATCSLQIEGLT